MKKVLKVKLEPEVHDKFRSWAFNHRVTMQGELENYVSGLVDGGVPSVEAVERHAKEVSESKDNGIKTPSTPVSDPKQATQETIEKPACKHTWIVRNGKTQCQYCGVKP